MVIPWAHVGEGQTLSRFEKNRLVSKLDLLAQTTSMEKEKV